MGVLLVLFMGVLMVLFMDFLMVLFMGVLMVLFRVSDGQVHCCGICIFFCWHCAFCMVSNILSSLEIFIVFRLVLKFR